MTVPQGPATAKMLAILMFVALALGACDTMNYQEGRMDGCLSGEWAAGLNDAYYLKDEARAKVDREYAAAWEEHFWACKYEREANSPDGPTE